MSILETYRNNTPLSAEAHGRAQKSIFGGNSRGSAVWEPYPLTIQRANGTQLVDVDGREYTDLINNYTSLVHGHAYPPIVEVASRQIYDGSAWTGNNHWQTELAEMLIERLPAAESVRFTNSGTEAGLLALQIARTVTGRLKILMPRYGYHGSLMEFEIGSLDGVQDFHGADTTYLGTFNDAESFEKVLAEHGSEIAAVFVEPIMGAGGVLPATAEFIQRVHKAAHAAGALFVADEVITFRMSTGGAQANWDLNPDLTMLGKIVGGGFPVGAVTGKREYMKIFDPANPKGMHSGTFNANPVTMAAGLVSVRELTQTRIDQMGELCARLDTSLTASANQLGLPISINRSGSLMNIFFSKKAGVAGLVRTDRREIGLFHLAALNHGLMLAGRGMIALSTVMDVTLIDDVAERAAAAMADVAAESDP